MAALAGTDPLAVPDAPQVKSHVSHVAFSGVPPLAMPNVALLSAVHLPSKEQAWFCVLLICRSVGCSSEAGPETLEP